MGRGYIVDDTVEKYLAQLCVSNEFPVTGFLIGQSSAQKDYIILAAQTPQKEEMSAASGSVFHSLDLVWITEHARQVSEMLPGGLYVLGMFAIADTDAKDAMITLRQLTFTVEKLISGDRLWSLDEDDITDRVALHVNPTTMQMLGDTPVACHFIVPAKGLDKLRCYLSDCMCGYIARMAEERAVPELTVCRTFDIKDPKSTVKPAVWKYQSDVCASWSMVSCYLEVDIAVEVPDDVNNLEQMKSCLKEGLKTWVYQIEDAVCLIDGKRLPEDADLTKGQKRNVKRTFKAQLLLRQSSDDEEEDSAEARECAGTFWMKGGINGLAYVHSNKPKAKLAERLLKRDVVSTMAERARVMGEELLKVVDDTKEKQQMEHFCLPRRVYCPVKGAEPVSVCDYQFNDESKLIVVTRLLEVLDIDVSEEDVDSTQEMDVEPEEAIGPDEETDAIEPTALKPTARNYVGVAMAAAVGLLASAASLLYLE